MATTSKRNKPLSVKDGDASIFSNVHIFYAIAKESYVEMKADQEMRMRPKPNGEKGNIIALDPHRKGFKRAFITIVFCGVCLDALLHLLIVKKFGIVAWEELDQKSFKEKTYEKKLGLLRCADQSILDKCGQLRTCRNEIVHEKIYLDDGKIKFAQKEAEKSFMALNAVCEFFNIKLA